MLICEENWRNSYHFFVFSGWTTVYDHLNERRWKILLKSLQLSTFFILLFWHLFLLSNIADGTSVTLIWYQGVNCLFCSLLANCLVVIINAQVVLSNALSVYLLCNLQSQRATLQTCKPTNCTDVLSPIYQSPPVTISSCTHTYLHVVWQLTLLRACSNATISAVSHWPLFASVTSELFVLMTSR